MSEKWPNRDGEPNRSLFTHAIATTEHTTRERAVLLAAIPTTGYATLLLSITTTYVTYHHYHHHHSRVVGHVHRDIQISGISVIKISPFPLKIYVFPHVTPSSVYSICFFLFLLSSFVLNEAICISAFMSVIFAICEPNPIFPTDCIIHKPHIPLP